jgi:hypothetical protein
MTDGDDIVARLERLMDHMFRTGRWGPGLETIKDAMSEIVDLRAQLFNEQEARKDGNV